MAKKTTAKTTKKQVKAKKSRKSTVSFDYIKSYQFRVIRVDGVHGGVTPRADAVQMALFSERRPIPQKEKYQIERERLGKRVEVQGRKAIIREVEVEAIMNLDTAKRISDWLKDKIQAVEQLKSRQK